MKLEKARKVIKALLLVGIVLCITALIIQGSYPVIGVYMTLGGVICVVMSLVMVFTYMRCPFCGKHFFVNCLVVKVCPHCRRHLVAGTKVKNKKIK